MQYPGGNPDDVKNWYTDYPAMDKHLTDNKGRICILMAWNTDLGDGLEWADDPSYPSKYSTYSFKFLANVIVYAMTH